jgi:hypothetical protein
MFSSVIENKLKNILQCLVISIIIKIIEIKSKKKLKNEEIKIIIINIS